MGIDHLSANPSDTQYQDRFDSMLSKRIYGLNLNITKEGSKSEKAVKTLRTTQEGQEE
jgi:hypothetical protein